MKKPERVTVKWLDALCKNETGVSADDIDPTCVVRTVGWVVKLTKDYLVLAMDWDEDGTFNVWSSIPRGMILKPKRFKGR